MKVEQRSRAGPPLKAGQFQMDAITGAVIVIPTLISWGLIRIGVWIGAARASRYIVDGFAQALDLKRPRNELDGTNQCLSLQRPWHSVVGVLAPRPAETADENKRRFNSYEDRMKRMWEYYD
jgi:hypothetical protein